MDVGKLNSKLTYRVLIWGNRNDGKDITGLQYFFNCTK